MDWGAVFQIVAASIASIGAAGAIIFALSSWLGKVWASRILEKEKHKFGTELEQTKRELDVIKETTLTFQSDRIKTYRAIIDVVARMLASFDAHETGRLSPQDAGSRFDEFNENRLRIYGYLAMLAPQAVMDAQDTLMDHLLTIANGSTRYEWSEIRLLAINLLNEMRRDIGIDKSPIEYKGKL